MTKAERAIKEASKRVAAYTYDASKYETLPSGSYKKTIIRAESGIKNDSKNK